MEQFIDFIISNLFLFIIIISGIVGFFNNQQKEKETEKRKKPINRPKQASSTADSNSKKSQPIEEVDTEPQVSMKAVEEQQKEQMERLATQIKAGAKQTAEDVSENVNIDNLLKKQKKNTEIDHAKLKGQIRGNLHGKGLINGIIMSEVLGQPRALKPYRNVSHERRRK